MQGPIKRTPDRTEALETIRQTPGLIPVAIDCDGNLLWRDLGRYHPYEGFFVKTLAAIDSLQALRHPSRPVEYIQTPMSILQDEDLALDCIPPSGFIFHIGRCGSTLLAKVLSRARSNLVFSEAMAHNAIWPRLIGEGAAAAAVDEVELNLYHRLVLAMGRRRLEPYRYHFIKFSSLNILFAESILRAFPHTPAIFIYRDPAEVLVSLLNKKPGWLKDHRSIWRKLTPELENASAQGDLHYLVAVLRQRMQVVLAGGHSLSRLELLDYRQLTAGNIEALMAHFNAEYSDAELDMMRYQFSHYSKNDFMTEPFHSDRVEKQRSLTPEMAGMASEELAPLYQRLKASPRNLSL